jgi:hypothetical protein
MIYDNFAPRPAQGEKNPSAIPFKDTSIGNFDFSSRMLLFLHAGEMRTVAGGFILQ